jgi:hypothetical protein
MNVMKIHKQKFKKKQKAKNQKKESNQIKEEAPFSFIYHRK